MQVAVSEHSQLLCRSHYNKILAQADEARGLILSARLIPTGKHVAGSHQLQMTGTTSTSICITACVDT